MISREDIIEAADLSMIELDEEEVDLYLEDLKKVFQEIDREYENIDVEGFEPAYFINNRQQVLREDKVGESLSKEDALKNAPESEYGYFKLLNVMD